MSATTPRGHGDDTGSPTVETEEPTRDDIYEILSNPRRRYAVHYLQFHEEPVELGTLAEQLAAWECDTTVRNVTSTQRKRTYTALQQEHLPKMDRVGIVEFERRDGIIKPAEPLSDIEIYTEVISGWNFPWSDYYLGLSAVTAALLTAAALDIVPFGLFPDIGWAVFCVTAFAVSAFAHAYITRRMKLGKSPNPPELRT
jgi:hypothetical protein